MTEHIYANPEADAAARASQVAAMAITIAEAIARVQHERIVQRTIEDESAARAARAERIASHASARVAWSPALNDKWVQNAEIPSLFAAWAPAVGWAATDPDANYVANRTERRLAEIYPLAMQRYAEARAEGLDAAAAIGEASPCFVATPQPQSSQVQTTKAIAVQTVRSTPPAPARRR